MKVSLSNIVNTILVATLLFSLTFGTVTSSIGVYDPWFDTNDDGKIDMRDLGNLARMFGAEGTPINKTELLLQLLNRVEQLNATVIQQEIALYELNDVIVNMNQTITVLNSSCSSYPKLLYSGGGGKIAYGIQEGTTGWVTMKSITIPNATITNRTAIIRWNCKSLCMNEVSPSRYTCQMRITINGIEEYSLVYNPPHVDTGLANVEFECTRHYAILVPAIDNSVELVVNLDFRIDCAFTSSSGYAYMAFNLFEFFA